MNKSCLLSAFFLATITTNALGMKFTKGMSLSVKTLINHVAEQVNATIRFDTLEVEEELNSILNISPQLLNLTPTKILGFLRGILYLKGYSIIEMYNNIFIIKRTKKGTQQKF